MITFKKSHENRSYKKHHEKVKSIIQLSKLFLPKFTNKLSSEEKKFKN